jgi:hypothetical protein
MRCISIVEFECVDLRRRQFDAENDVHSAARQPAKHTLCCATPRSAQCSTVETCPRAQKQAYARCLHRCHPGPSGLRAAMRADVVDKRLMSASHRKAAFSCSPYGEREFALYPRPAAKFIVAFEVFVVYPVISSGTNKYCYSTNSTRSIVIQDWPSR